jgi:hypothetical protein
MYFSIFKRLKLNKTLFLPIMGHKNGHILT